MVIQPDEVVKAYYRLSLGDFSEIHQTAYATTDFGIEFQGTSCIINDFCARQMAE